MVNVTGLHFTSTFPLHPECLILPPIPSPRNTTMTNVSLPMLKQTTNDPEVFIWICVSAVLCFLGVLTNLILLLVIFKFKNLRKGAGGLVIHLLAVQLMTFATILPAGTGNVYLASRAHIINCQFCRYHLFFGVTFPLIVGWNEALLALNRLVGVFLPTKYATLDRPVPRFSGLLLCWLLPLSMTFAIIFQYKVIPKMSPFGNCFSIPLPGSALVLLPFHVYIPLAIITATSVAISVKFLRDRAWKRGAMQEMHQQRMNRCPVASIDVPTFPVQATLLVKRSRMSERHKQMSTMLSVGFISTFFCQLLIFVVVATGLIGRFPKLALWALLPMMVNFCVKPVSCFLITI